MRFRLEAATLPGMRVANLWLALCAWGQASCAPESVPCLAQGACDTGQECLANRCVPEGGYPVPERGERAVLHPTQVAVSGNAGSSLTTHAVLGGPSAHAQTLFLGFELGAVHTSARSPALHAAFLLLPPRDNAQPLTHEVRLSVRRLGTRWDASTIAEGFLPRAAAGEQQALARGRHAVRVDVTELLKDCFEQAEAFDGFMVRGVPAPDSPTSQAFVAATGVADDSGPRLELYFSPPAALRSHPPTTREPTP